MTQAHTFSIREMLSLGWNSFKENKQILVSVTFLYFLVSIIPSIIEYISQIERISDDPIFIILSVCINIASFILGLVVPIGYVYITLSIIDGASVKVGDLFSTRGVFWKFLFASVFSTLAFMIGFVLFVIPGIFIMVSLVFWGYIVVDQKVSSVQALKTSYHLTKGYRWKILGFFVVACLINIIGFILIGIGLLVTIPVTALALAHMYRYIRHQQSDIVSRADHSLTPVRLT